MKIPVTAGGFGEAKKKKSRRERVIPLLPNLFTTGNLFFGLLSIMTSIQLATVHAIPETSNEWVYRKFWWAAAFILIAGFLDMLDGKLARIFKSESNFGISYDSLSDLVSFGVAPGILIYVWVLLDSGKLGLMAVLFYIVCTALRLARFNVQSKTVERYNFIGLPSPMAAGLMLSPVLLFSGFKIPSDEAIMWFYLVSAPFVGLLMVSDVPYWKYPRIRFSGPFNALVVASIIIAAVITNPEIMLLFLVYLYCLLGLSFYLIEQLRKKPEITPEVESNKQPEDNL
ncbi:MAG TPA: CDP-diacylglycerol--serine O-phosphatidyltransferase [Thermodesulfobacteriota bacterium]|nr:CDP-diacylglycerol--serine O-phosphatidyltransferase [Thermodesulfobacteriota bacterium]